MGLLYHSDAMTASPRKARSFAGLSQEMSHRESDAATPQLSAYATGKADAKKIA